MKMKRPVIGLLMMNFVLACTEAPVELAPTEMPEATVATYTDWEGYSILAHAIERVLANAEYVALNAESRGLTVEQTRQDLEDDLARFREEQSSPMASTAAHCSDNAAFEDYGTVIAPTWFGNVEVLGYTEAVEPSWIEALLSVEVGHNWWGAPGGGYWWWNGDAPDDPWTCYEMVSVSVTLPQPSHRPYYIWAMTIHRLRNNDNDLTVEVTEELVQGDRDGGGPIW